MTRICKNGTFTGREYDRSFSNSQFQQSKYTTATIRFVNKTDSPFLDAHNICVDASFTWKIYRQSGSMNFQYPDNQSSGVYLSNDSLGFRYSHKLQIVHSALPKRAKWIENGYYYVFKPCQLRHIGHFAESLNHALLKLRYPSFYPPLTDIYIPQFTENDFEWSKTYLQLVLSLFPEDFKPAVHIANSIRLSRATCFRSAVSQ